MFLPLVDVFADDDVSEVIVGLSVLAAHHAAALLTAVQGTHERAAGEWQVEWDALPLVCAAAAGALAGAGRVMPALDDVLDPDSYLGETDAIVSAAISRWTRVTCPSDPAAGRARP